MIKVTHIITGLNVGGAEMMLYKLLTYTPEGTCDSEVISLTTVGPIGEKIRTLGIPVHEVGLHRGLFAPSGFFKLVGLIRKRNPEVIQTWLYHADVLGSFAVFLSGKNISIVWGIRMSNLSKSFSKLSTKFMARIGAIMSYWVPRKVVCVSESAKKVHEKLGYKTANMVVIPNGFDLEKFYPDAKARSLVRAGLRVPQDALLVGYVARFDKQKDHHTFVKAAKILSSAFPQAHFVLCGRDVSWNNREFVQWIQEVELRDAFHLLGERDDISQLTAAFDVATLTARYGEGFPNVVGEAMACGVPCVVTDVGDAADIVADTGVVAEIGNAESIARGWGAVLSMKEENRAALGKKARERVTKLFSIDRVVREYYNLYQDVCSKS